MAATTFLGQTITLPTGTVGTITGHDEEQGTWRVTTYHGEDSALAGRPARHDHFPTHKIVEMLKPPARYTIRVVGPDARDTDGVPRVMHSDDLNDMILLGRYSMYSCEVVDNSTGKLVEV